MILAGLVTRRVGGEVGYRLREGVTFPEAPPWIL